MRWHFSAAALLLLGLPQLRAIDESAALLLYATALCLFAIAWWEWTAALDEPGQQWLSLLAMAGTAAAGHRAGLLFIMYLVLLIEQLRQIPDMALFASEWEDRHSLLMRLRAEGQLDAVIPPRAFDLATCVMFGEMIPDSLESFSEYSKVKRHYGLRSITLAESD